MKFHFKFLFKIFIFNHNYYFKLKKKICVNCNNFLMEIQIEEMNSTIV